MIDSPLVPFEKVRLVALLLSIKNEYGWSQNRLAREVGTNSNSMSKWSNPDDRTMPAAKNLALIVRVASTLPASNPNSWIKTLDDLDAYLSGSDRAPSISLVQVMRFISGCDDLQALFDVMLAAMSQAKVLTAESSPGAEPSSNPYPV